MSVKTAENIIAMEYHYSQNFMTPTVEQYITVIPGKRAAELSSGRGFMDEPIFGLSVVDYDSESKSTTRRTDLSGMFTSRSAALARIEELKEEE